MSGIFKCALRAAILFWLPHLAWAQEQLRAGVAKTVVTPDVHKNKVYLAGFGHNRIATGVHDNLYARCLALAAGGQILVLCSVDVIGLFYVDVLKIREQMKVQAPEVSHLIVASTHVHEGPDTLLERDTGQIAEGHTWRKAELVGTTVGQLVERVLKSSETAAVHSILIRKSTLFAPLENDHFRVAEAAGIFSRRKPLYTDGKVDSSTIPKELTGTGVTRGVTRLATGHDLQTEVDYIELRSSERVAAEIVTIPGELYPELTNGGITRYPGADYPDAAFEPI